MPATVHQRDIWLVRSKAYADACARNAPELLSHMRTVDVAYDMDAIRRALGVERISYYGFSYGTYLGQVYATLFPHRLRRMVLDSNVDPRGVSFENGLAFNVATERNLRIWFAWLATNDRAYHLGDTPAKVARHYADERKALQGHPAGDVVGPAEWDDVFLLAAYGDSAWTFLGSVLSGWVHDRDASGLVLAYQFIDLPGVDNSFAVFNAVTCTDGPTPPVGPWLRANWATFRKAPLTTWGSAWYAGPCLFWPARPGTPVEVRGGPVRALLVDETLDAATPFEGSLEVRSRFPKSRLIAEPGGITHAGTLLGNSCVDDQIAAYLDSGALPPRRVGRRADTSCAPSPRPVPSGASAPASSTPMSERLQW